MSHATPTSAPWTGELFPDLTSSAMDGKALMPDFSSQAKQLMAALVSDISEACAAVGVHVYAASWDGVEQKIATALKAVHQQGQAEGLKEAMELVDSIKEPHSKRANTWSVRVFWVAEELRRRAALRGRVGEQGE